MQDRYVLERELGSGGMAVVYLALDLHHDRRVALKVLRPELAAMLGTDRFVREIRLTAALSHPHILPVFDSGITAGQLWYTMPYVDGESLRARLVRERQLPVEEALTLVRDAALALDYAHRQNIVHRDVKPENLLLQDGQVLVADFGIARLLTDAGAERLTGTGLSIGTPAYMSPEQAGGGDLVDRRSDVYSLGCVLYELLAGEPPFTGTPQAIVAKRLMTPAPSPRVVRPDLAPSIELILRRALAITPADRYRGAAEFAAALDASTREIQDRSVTPMRQPSPRWSRIAVAAVIVGAVVTAVVAAAALRRNGDGGTPPAPRSIAVLPFDNLGATSDGYFADGLTEEVTGRLAQLPGLTVISRRSAFHYRSTTKPLRQIGRELGVAYILEGSVRWVRTPDGGGRVRVTPALVRVADDRQLWSDGLDGTVDDIFAVQRRIAEQVAASLALKLGEPERAALGAQPTRNPAAYDEYLRANQAFSLVAETGGNTRIVNQAIEGYERTVRLDSTFAQAWARLSIARSLIRQGSSTAPQAVPRLARLAAERAIALAPGLPEAHVARAWTLPPMQAIDSLRAADRRIPNNPEILRTLAKFLRDTRAPCQESAALLERALQMEPRSVQLLRDLSGAYKCEGRQAESSAAVAKLLEIAPDLAEAWQLRAAELLDRGDLAGGRAVMQEAERHVDRTELVTYMAAVNDLYWALTDAQRAYLLGLPAAAFGHDTLTWALALTHTLAYQGDTAGARHFAEQARLVAARSVAREPESRDYRVYLSNALAYLGDAAGARREGEHGASPTDHQYIQFQLMRTYEILGDLDRAFAVFKASLSPTFPGPGEAEARIDPLFTPLKGHPGFERWLATR